MISEAAMGAAVSAVCVLVSIKKDGEYCAIKTKEVIKEQTTPTNLSATARRVLQCTRSQ